MRITGYHVYRIYTTYKAHFNTKGFSVDKYNFNLLKPDYEKFMEVKGQHYFDILAERYKKVDFITPLFIVAFMDDPRVWIGDIVSNISYYIDLKVKWEGKLANLGYTFKRECIYLLEKGLKFDVTLADFVFNEWMNDNISIETLIIFKKIFKLSLDNNIAYDYSFSSKYEKYECLLLIDKDKYKSILKEAIMSSQG